VLALLVIFVAGLCGYFQASALTWLVAAMALVSVSLAQHQLTLWRAIDRGHLDLAQDTFVRSFAHALIATGGCYWLGYVVRLISGL
jgi:hypothetical protein